MPCQESQTHKQKSSNGAKQNHNPARARRDKLLVVKRLLSASRNEHWRLFAAIVFALGSTFAHLAAPAYSAYVIDLLWKDIQAAWETGRPFMLTLDNAGREILIFFGIWTLAWIFYTLQSFTMASFAECLNLKLRLQVSEKLNKLPLRFFDSNKPGDIMSRVTNDLDKVSEVLQRGALTLITSVCLVLGSLAAMSYYNLTLTSMFCGCIIAALGITHIIAKQTVRLAKQQQYKLGTLSGLIEEAYAGRLVITSFNREQASSDRIHAASQELADVMRRTDFATNVIGPSVRFLVRIAQVVLAFFGIRFLMQGVLTIGVVQAFFQYVSTASEPLTQFSLTINQLQSALAAADRVFNILDEQEVAPNPELPASLPDPICGRICFEHVSFGYDPKHPLMQDVNFVAEPGQKVAIVGATGAGKTTLINLLMRFYEIDGGRITLDGIDIRALRREDLRRAFGMVLQDSWLCEGTIAENIAYARPEARHNEIVEAAKTAQVDFFVRTMPQGYETKLENDAGHISQGQRQLLTIARVLLANPSILILDEATSSVDTRTERAIVQAMEALTLGRTSFVIAHRLSTIVDADLILVMDHGAIIEQGTHEELLAARGAYAELYQSQFAS